MWHLIKWHQYFTCDMLENWYIRQVLWCTLVIITGTSSFFLLWNWHIALGNIFFSSSVCVLCSFQTCVLCSVRLNFLLSREPRFWLPGICFPATSKHSVYLISLFTYAAIFYWFLIFDRSHARNRWHKMKGVLKLWEETAAKNLWVPC